MPFNAIMSLTMKPITAGCDVIHFLWIFVNIVQNREKHSIYCANSNNNHISFRTCIEKILRSTNVCKAEGIDDLWGRFLKDGSRVLSKPISELWNLSIKLGSFPDPCKIVKLKPLFKKEFKTNPSNYWPISLLPLIPKS